ncbi:MAG: protein kinase [Chloroflexi bacterium]|nr:protein kinase [Chloroflexota bacterium]
MRHRRWAVWATIRTSSPCSTSATETASPTSSPRTWGGNLEGLLQQAENHRLPIAEALRIAVEVRHALEHAHSRGIIRRDPKPGNIWLTEDRTAKLGDFGLGHGGRPLPGHRGGHDAGHRSPHAAGAGAGPPGPASRPRGRRRGWGSNPQTACGIADAKFEHISEFP